MMSKPRARLAHAAASPRRVVCHMALRLFACGAAACGPAGLAHAGPPFLTDDPQPTDRGHWEIYGFVSGSHIEGLTAGEAGLDLNYGAAPDLQLTCVLPAAFEQSGRIHAGAGMIELAAKYRLPRRGGGDAGLELALFPRLLLPTAPARFGSPHASLLLPVWMSRDRGAWSAFGGGGWELNPGAGNRNFWLGGVGLTRALTPSFTAGVEVFHRTADATDGTGYTTANLGFTYAASQHWSLLASAGPGMQNARRQGLYNFYLALRAYY